ncbi:MULTISPECIES: hypothetical protein [Brucella]|uniref:DUF7946 domain-containing protein n=1 Tax=Brucella TaxID=234 RepID=UPI0008710AF3|nr:MULTISPECIES: hypothetical protein [Brucella]MDH0366588.1 hypothetical protein [Brucella anthropi]SCD24871.1 hypothetical protein BR141012304_20398 [Brucella inopinata]
MGREISIPLKIVFRGGDADQGRLDLYDGADAIFGFAKALQIATHAFVKYSITKSAPSIKGAKIYLQPPSAGSFIEPLQAVITDPSFMAGVTTGVITNAFYDFIKLSLGRAAGLLFDPETATIRKRIEKDEPFFDELADILEGPLREAHRTIEETGGTVSLERPRSKLLTFDTETLDWVKTREEDEASSYRLGTVTRFNILSHNGRMFDKTEGRTIPFKRGEYLNDASVLLLSKSLDDANNKLPGLLEFQVTPVRSARGTIKRFILSSCRKPGTLGPAHSM